MADRYQGALNQIESQMAKELSLHETPPRYLALISNLAGKEMSQNDAIRILEIFYNQYRRQNRPTATKYCVLEMERLLYCSRHLYLQETYPLIDFSGPVKTELAGFVDRKRPLYQQLFNKFLKRWTIQASIVLAIFLAIMVLVLKQPFFLWFGITVALWFAAQWYGTHKRVPAMIQSHMKRYYRHLDAEHKKLVKSWKVRSPRLFTRRKKEETLAEISARNSSRSSKKIKQRQSGSGTQEFSTTIFLAPEPAREKRNEKS